MEEGAASGDGTTAGRAAAQSRARQGKGCASYSLLSPLLSSPLTPLLHLSFSPLLRLGYVVSVPAFYKQAGFMDDVCAFGAWAVGGERARGMRTESEKTGTLLSASPSPIPTSSLILPLFPSHSLPIPPNPPPSPGKEYAKADSRYAARDAFTIVMEGVTAFFVGPLCLAAAWAYTAAAPWRHLAALVASVCQLYGDALYFGTAAFEGMAHTRGEPLYFWFYFVVLNGVWVVLPGVVAWHAGREIVGACGGGGAGVGGSRRQR